MFGVTRFAVLLAAIALAPGVAAAQVTIDSRLAPGQPAVVIAHRASVGGAPENSLAGMARAIELGVAMVEVDVQITREGQYILMHDPVLSRTSNVAEVFPDGSPYREPDDPMARRYLISDYTLDEIAKLRLTDPQGGDHPVPSLDAALDLAAGKLLVILELKNWDVDTLAPILARHETDNVVLFNQTDRWKLRDTVEATGIGVFASLERARDLDEALAQQVEWFGPHLKMVEVPARHLAPEFSAKVQELGVDLCISGTNDEDFALSQGDPGPWQAALEAGVPCYFTSEPDALLGLMAR